MKKLLILLLLACNCYSQYKIEYDYTSETNDSFGNAKTISKCYLYTDNVRSKFIKDRVINGRYEQELQYPNKDLEEKFKSEDKGMVYGDSIGYVVTKFMETDSIYLRTPGAILVKEKLEKIDFKIQDEFKTISTYNCQKAIASVYGREFEIWFTNEIAIHDGPWKLSGLPGLIIEVHSTDRNHNFYFTSIKKMSSSTYLYSLPTFKKIEDRAERIKARIKSVETQFKYKKSKNPDSVLKMTINDLDLPIIEFK
ncbi:MAG: GLPGLI family protein [Flavobacterium sp.]